MHAPKHQQKPQPQPQPQMGTQLQRSLNRGDAIAWDKPWKSIRPPNPENSPNGYNAMALYHQRVYYYKILSTITAEKYNESFKSFTQGMTLPWIQSKKQVIENLFNPNELEGKIMEKPVTLSMDDILHLKRLQQELGGKFNLSVLNRYTQDTL